MGFSDRVRNAVDALLGVSAFQPEGQGYGPQVDSKVVESVRKAMGGNLSPLPTTKLRWYLEDLETAQNQADAGGMQGCARLVRAMRRDGTLKGLLDGRTKGLVRLPKRFYGNNEVGEVLRARNGTRSVFDEMFPPSEVRLLDGDGIQLGVGVAELVPVKGRDYPVMVRLEPEFLYYRWAENKWYFQSNAGSLPITPGDGRWILHLPGGRLTPWNSGNWPALGRAFINKEHAISYRANYCAKLANPARLAYAPAGATEPQRLGFFRKMLAWGVNTVLEMPPGWEAKLLESNGRGWEVFQRQIDTCDNEIMIQLAGQLLTTKGGTGFDGQDVAHAILQSLIQDDGDDIAYTLNTQGLPAFIVERWGVEALQKATIVSWDTGTSDDRERETRVLGQCADAIIRLNEALAPYDKSVNVEEMTTRFGAPIQSGAIEPSVDADVDVDEPMATKGAHGRAA